VGGEDRIQETGDSPEMDSGQGDRRAQSAKRKAERMENWSAGGMEEWAGRETTRTTGRRMRWGQRTLHRKRPALGNSEHDSRAGRGNGTTGAVCIGNRYYYWTRWVGGSMVGAVV